MYLFLSPKTGCDTWARRRPRSRETRRGLGGWRTLSMGWASLPRSRLHSTTVEPRGRLASDDPSANTRKLKCKRHWHIYLGRFCTQDRRQSSSIYIYHGFIRRVVLICCRLRQISICHRLINMGIFHCDGQFRVLVAVWAPSFGETHLLEVRRILRQQTSQVTHHAVIAILVNLCMHARI